MEEKILFDADKLDAAGPVGIAALAKQYQKDAVSFYESLLSQVSPAYETGKKELAAHIGEL